VPTLEMLAGNVISHVWQSDHSALYLELGPLSPGKLHKNGVVGNPVGLRTIYAGYKWRVEDAHSAVVTSSCDYGARVSVLAQLTGARVSSATLTGHIPELLISFDNGMWLATFTLSKGQPEWTVTFCEGPTVHLCIEQGRLAVDSRDS
jgi:hypothetical protein